MDSVVIVLLTVSLLAIVFPFLGAISRNFVYCIFPMILLADALGPPLPLAWGGYHTGHLVVAMLIGLVVLSIPRFRFDLVTIIISITLIYFASVIMMYSSNIIKSLDTYVKVFLAMLMFPIGFYSINSWKKFERFAISIRFVVIIVVIIFMINQIYHLGVKEYRVEEGAFTGGSGVYTSYIVTYIGCLMPLLIPLYPNQRSRWVTIGLFGICILVMLLIFRRGPILALVLAGLVHLSFGQWEMKTRLLKLGAALCLILILLLPFMWSRVEAMYQHRVAEGIQHELEQSGGRKAEIDNVLQMYQDWPLYRKFVGEELFNAWGRYDFTRRRTLHVDYMIVLQGGGLIGLVLFLSIYGAMGWQFLQWQRQFTETSLAGELKGAFWSLLLCSLTLSATNQIWAIVPYSFFFLLSGILMRLAEQMAAGSARAGLRVADDRLTGRSRSSVYRWPKVAAPTTKR